MSGEYGPHVGVSTEGAVTRITLDRPDRLNAFAGTMRSDLCRALEDATRGVSRVIVITGAGRGFCAGADIEALAALLESSDEESFSELVRAGKRVVRAIRSAPQLVVASLNGVAAGAGASLAAACDLRIASDAARIGFTFIRIGLHPDWGATHTVPRLVGTARATELFFTGRIVEADEALRIGLVDRVVPASSLEEETADWATELAEHGFEARAAMKATLSDAAHLERCFAAELKAQLLCFRSAEARERVAAFLSHRT